MNRILVVLFAGMGLASLLLGISFGVYDNDVFQNRLPSSLEIASVIEKDPEHSTYTIPLDDNSVNRPTYKFIIKNSSGFSNNYRLLIEETPIKAVNDGCKIEDLMRMEDLKYELIKNNKSIKKGFLKDLRANILLETKIKPRETEEFELKTWIPLTTTSWMGKHFHYRISIAPIK